MAEVASNIIPEASQVKEEKKTESPQSQSNKSTARLVNRLLEISNKATKNMRSEWPDNYRFVVSGKQWPIRRPRWRFSEVVNLTWSNIMTEVGIQTDGRPRVDYTAQEPSDFEFAEILKEINEANWGKSSVTGHGWEQKVSTAVFKSKLYHVIHAEVGWDEELEGGLGDVKLKILDPYGCFWDPIAKNLNECRWFIHTEARPTGELRKKYPGIKDRIKPDLSIFPEGSGDGISDTDLDLWFHSADGRVNTLDGSTIRSDVDTDEKFGGEPMTMFIRCWLKDDTVEEMKEEKEVGGEVQVEFIKKKKFPKGRYIEVVNNIAVTDRENEFEDGQFPIARLVNYDYGEYAGENEVTHQRGPQNIVNYTWSHMLDQMKKGAVPQWLVSNRAHNVVKKLTDEPGLVVEVPDLTSVRREPGVPIAGGMFNLLDNAINLIDKVSGLQDVSRGSPQPGVTSGILLEGFVEAAQTRPRLKNRSLDQFLGEIGYLCASRYLQFYTVPRVFRITNKQGFPEFVEFFIQGQGDERLASIRRFQRTEGGTTIPEQSVQVGVRGIPDVKVVSGSGLPFARAQKQAIALDLHGRGAITLETLLKTINFPNAEEEAKKVEEQQAALAEQQAAEQGAPPVA